MKFVYKSFDHRLDTIVIIFEPRKVFDWVNIEMFSSKLELLGISDNVMPLSVF